MVVMVVVVLQLLLLVLLILLLLLLLLLVYMLRYRNVYGLGGWLRPKEGIDRQRR